MLKQQENCAWCGALVTLADQGFGTGYCSESCYQKESFYAFLDEEND